MNIQEEIINLKSRLDSLQESFIQSQRNAVEVTANADTGKQAMAQVMEITPYTETKTAYYGEKEKNFYNVPQGILTVYFDNYTGSYSVERIDDRLTVSFDTLENDTNITIIVQ